MPGQHARKQHGAGYGCTAAALLLFGKLWLVIRWVAALSCCAATDAADSARALAVALQLYSASLQDFMRCGMATIIHCVLVLRVILLEGFVLHACS